MEAGTKYTISGKQYPTDGKVEPDRFTPDYLEVTEVQGLEISDGCDDSGFSYIGQPLNVSTTPTLKIQGMSATGSETMNYQIGSGGSTTVTGKEEVTHPHHQVMQ